MLKSLYADECDFVSQLTRIQTKHSYQIEYKYQWQCVEPDCQRM